MLCSVGLRAFLFENGPLQIVFLHERVVILIQHRSMRHSTEIVRRKHKFSLCSPRNTSQNMTPPPPPPPPLCRFEIIHYLQAYRSNSRLTRQIHPSKSVFHQGNLLPQTGDIYEILSQWYGRKIDISCHRICIHNFSSLLTTLWI